MRTRGDLERLQDGGIYSLALTAYQYTARRHSGPAEGVVWLLLPEWPDNPLIGGPVAYILSDGRIGVKEGITAATIADLDFTGRYKSDDKQDNV